MKKFALALLLAVFFLSPADAQPIVSKQVAGVTVYGELTSAEERLLTALNERMIPLPDTIRVEARNRDNGFIEKGGSTIVLSHSRHRPPSEAEANPPYLYGRTKAQAALPLPSQYHTLAHELAHFLQWRVFNGRPALPAVIWWEYEGATNPYRIRVETEAELMAIALGRIAFDNPVNAYGFPEQIWAGSVEPLTRDYKAAILDFYRVTNP